MTWTFSNEQGCGAHRFRMWRHATPAEMERTPLVKVYELFDINGRGALGLTTQLKRQIANGDRTSTDAAVEATVKFLTHRYAIFPDTIREIARTAIRIYTEG